MSLDTVILCAGVIAEVAVLVILLQRRVGRLLPVFGTYVAWTIFSDLAFILIKQTFPSAVFRSYMIEVRLDAVLQLGVLVELAWSVLRPIRASLPRGAIVVVAALIVLAGTGIWLVAGMTVMQGLGPESRSIIHLQQTLVVLRILFFVVLAALSQLLAIGWRHRELQVATGLGIYSLTSFGANLIQMHQSSPAQYHMFDRIVSISYVCSLLYWAFAFLQKEAPRQEFSPRMQSILLTVAGAARANRLAMEEIAKPPKP